MALFGFLSSCGNVICCSNRDQGGSSTSNNGNNHYHEQNNPSLYNQQENGNLHPTQDRMKQLILDSQRKYDDEDNMTESVNYTGIQPHQNQREIQQNEVNATPFDQQLDDDDQYFGGEGEPDSWGYMVSSKDVFKDAFVNIAPIQVQHEQPFSEDEGVQQEGDANGFMQGSNNSIRNSTSSYTSSRSSSSQSQNSSFRQEKIGSRPSSSRELTYKASIRHRNGSQTPEGSAQREKTTKRTTKAWTEEEDRMLRFYYSKHNGKWPSISNEMSDRNASQCSQRWRRIKPSKIRRPWTQEEDDIVLQLIAQHGKNWGLISGQMDNRSGKQVRERYINKLDPSLNNDQFTEEEDNKIIEQYRAIGPKWSDIAKVLVGRSENMVKNRFYSFIRKTYSIGQPPQNPVPWQDMTSSSPRVLQSSGLQDDKNNSSYVSSNYNDLDPSFGSGNYESDESMSENEGDHFAAPKGKKGQLHRGGSLSNNESSYGTTNGTTQYDESSKQQSLLLANYLPQSHPNTTQQPLQLGGLYLSDGLDNDFIEGENEYKSTLFQIPTSATSEPADQEINGSKQYPQTHQHNHHQQYNNEQKLFKHPEQIFQPPRSVLAVNNSSLIPLEVYYQQQHSLGHQQQPQTQQFNHPNHINNNNSNNPNFNGQQLLQPEHSQQLGQSFVGPAPPLLQKTNVQSNANARYAPPNQFNAPHQYPLQSQKQQLQPQQQTKQQQQPIQYQQQQAQINSNSGQQYEQVPQNIQAPPQIQQNLPFNNQATYQNFAPENDQLRPQQPKNDSYQNPIYNNYGQLPLQHQQQQQRQQFNNQEQPLQQQYQAQSNQLRNGSSQDQSKSGSGSNKILKMEESFDNSHFNTASSFTHIQANTHNNEVNSIVQQNHYNSQAQHQQQSTQYSNSNQQQQGNFQYQQPQQMNIPIQQQQHQQQQQPQQPQQQQQQYEPQQQYHQLYQNDQYQPNIVEQQRPQQESQQYQDVQQLNYHTETNASSPVNDVRYFQSQINQTNGVQNGNGWQANGNGQCNLMESGSNFARIGSNSHTSEDISRMSRQNSSQSDSDGQQNGKTKINRVRLNNLIVDLESQLELLRVQQQTYNGEDSDY